MQFDDNYVTYNYMSLVGYVSLSVGEFIIRWVCYQRAWPLSSLHKFKLKLDKINMKGLVLGIRGTHLYLGIAAKDHM